MLNGGAWHMSCYLLLLFHTWYKVNKDNIINETKITNIKKGIKEQWIL